ncbi:polyphenol oxidase, chloroplastic-like [Canna indica]|uniref:Polyphenol oxidase, chloroplastic-like n=1 Tax=Canna indica TaxID=4628 RepID=A0AAQ3KZE2_9LILI|nr:polyphenol oxidase, chloroplastic-like [Canna indica]
MATAASLLLSGTPSSACLRQRQRSHRRSVAPFRVSCRKGSDEPRPESGAPFLDRRDMLIGLGGLYGAAAGPMALANPVVPPDLTKCKIDGADAPTLGGKCCPPYNGTETIVDYDFPATALRVRRPAHLVIDDEDYMAKYKEAVRKMKELPADHPWNYYQQANVHCQYCNDAYDQQGTTDVPVQVHYSWIFLPWHRFYLHFYERILGKLIGDDTFTIPFWNFDNPAGMTYPQFLQELNSPLYDPERDQAHVKPDVLMDLKYTYGNKAGTGLEGRDLILSNLDYIKKTFDNSLPLPELFMGDPLRAGELKDDSSSGQLEVIHNSVHMWVGPPETDNYHVNMGNFSTAARDSTFFILHCNVDRLWDIYRHLRGNRLEFNDPDLLDSTFLFIDENERLVRVKLGDCFDASKLRYTYEQVYLPWLGKLSKQKKSETTDKATKQLSLTRVGEFGSAPQKLDPNTPLRVVVSRPKKSRKKSEKEEKQEVLTIKDIEVSLSEPSRFDVYIATPYGDLAGPDFGEFAGSFVRLQHMMGGKLLKKMVKKTKLKLGLNKLLEDIEGAEDAEKLVVTLVHRSGDITVGGVKIKLVETDTSTTF